MNDKIWYLKDINVLKNLSDAQRRQLGDACSMTQFRQGDQVYMPGQSDNIYFLKVGSIKLVTRSSDNQEIIKDVLERGEVFGKCFGTEASDVREQAFALEDCTICFLPIDQWRVFVEEHLSLNLSIMKWAGLRIKRLERKMESLYFKRTEERVRDILSDLAERVGKKHPDSDFVTIPFHLTHEELGQLTGCSRQNVTSILNELREQGFITYSRNKLVIKRPFSLK